jgi:hypothetical protein
VSFINVCVCVCVCIHIHTCGPLLRSSLLRAVKEREDKNSPTASDCRQGAAPSLVRDEKRGLCVCVCVCVYVCVCVCM